MQNKNEVSTVVKSFEDIKHIDEEGREYWNAHELSKALGYSEYSHFKPAIKRAQDQMRQNGIDPEEHLAGSRESFTSGNGAKREVDGYKLDRRAAYTTAMNADPSKPEVAIGQEYFLQNTAKVEAITKRLDDRDILATRDNLRIANKKLNRTILSHDVDPSEIGIVLDKGDQGLFNMSTREIKEVNNIPGNRPVSDFMGSDIATYKALAQIKSRKAIENENARGVDQVSDVVYEKNRLMRNEYINDFGDTPENMLPGEDVKKVEQRYKKQTKKYLEALEYES